MEESAVNVAKIRLCVSFNFSWHTKWLLPAFQSQEEVSLNCELRTTTAAWGFKPNQERWLDTTFTMGSWGMVTTQKIKNSGRNRWREEADRDQEAWTPTRLHHPSTSRLVHIWDAVVQRSLLHITTVTMPWRRKNKRIGDGLIRCLPDLQHSRKVRWCHMLYLSEAEWLTGEMGVWLSDVTHWLTAAACFLRLPWVQTCSSQSGGSTLPPIPDWTSGWRQRRVSQTECVDVCVDSRVVCRPVWTVQLCRD